MSESKIVLWDSSGNPSTYSVEETLKTSKVLLVAGCLVTRDKLYKITKQRICLGGKKNYDGWVKTDLSTCKLEESTIPYAEFKACPFCGLAIWENKEERIDGGLGFIDTIIPLRERKLPNGESVSEVNSVEKVMFFCVNGEPGAADSQWIVGRIIGEQTLSAIPEPIKSVDSADLKNQLKPALAAHDLWKDYTFGIYTVVANQ